MPLITTPARSPRWRGRPARARSRSVPGVRRSASTFMAPWPAQGSVPLVGLQVKCAPLLMAGQAGEGFGGLLLVGGWY